ncbi:hypothetical protein BK635_17480 [Pseudomonas chlororaphis]|uniref:hypothetical protein n=1 Tax=Pseudomonas chlororaphis TaxID=587753 RepID=UPI000FF83CEE|nr:hypothetical protein BK635_17480 [Pseudomonas chlororaphis]
MTDVFAKVALGPLLLAQGLYTRWVTPRLPPFYALTRLLREDSVVRLLGTTISCASATSMRCTLPGAFSMPR